MEKISLIFRFIIDQIKGQKKDRGDSLRFRNYYLRTKNDNRGTFAKIFDYSIWRIVMFCILFLFLYLRTNQLYLSMIVTLVTMIVLHIIAIRGRNRRFQQMKEQKRRYIASRRAYNEIMNKTIDEMEDYIKEVFTPMGFSQFEFIESAQRHILLKSLYKNDKIMILFNIYKNDFDVELKEVKEFIYTITDNRIKKGILVTTSNFTNDSYDFINKLSENYTLLLVNKEQLLKIIEESGLFPNEEEIDEMIESKISRKRNRLNEYKKTVLSKSKIKGYIILSLYLILTSWYTPYIIYYIIVASLILALALIIFIFNIRDSFEAEKDKSIDFEELLNNM